MAEEFITFPVTSETTKPVGGKSRRMSLETSTPLNFGKLVSPRYNRASIGSCHDLCKFGRKNPFETEATSPLSKRIAAKPIDHQDLVEILVSPGRKKISAAKLGHSISKAVTHNAFVDINCAESEVSKKSTGGENLMKTEIVAEKKKKNKMAVVKHKPLPNSTSNFRDIQKVASSPSEKKGVSKVASSLKSRKIQKAKPEIKNEKDDVVQEKTLYVIEMETQKKPLESREKEIHALESYKSPLPTSLTSSSLIVTESEVGSLSELDQTMNMGEDEKGGPGNVYLDKIVIDSVTNEPDSMNIVLRHEDVDEKENDQNTLNNVMKESLIETRKGKVRALVGAFETLISLQEKKMPSVGIEFPFVLLNNTFVFTTDL